jgi:hypothetical protein
LIPAAYIAILHYSSSRFFHFANRNGRAAPLGAGFLLLNQYDMGEFVGFFGERMWRAETNSVAALYTPGEKKIDFVLDLRTIRAAIIVDRAPLTRPADLLSSLASYKRVVPQSSPRRTDAASNKEQKSKYLAA